MPLRPGTQLAGSLRRCHRDASLPWIACGRSSPVSCECVCGGAYHPDVRRMGRPLIRAARHGDGAALDSPHLRSSHDDRSAHRRRVVRHRPHAGAAAGARRRRWRTLWQAISAGESGRRACFRRSLSPANPASRRNQIRNADDAVAPCPPETQRSLATRGGGRADAIVRWGISRSAPRVVAPGASAPAASCPAGFFRTCSTPPPRTIALRAAVPALAGESGLWIARRHQDFSWLLEESRWTKTPGTTASRGRLAWLRQTRAPIHPAPLRRSAAQWSGEDASMRESILRIIADSPQPCDETWLETLALKDRRQDVRELAAAALIKSADSGFRCRSHRRVRERVKIERRLLKRVIAIMPPDGIRSRLGGGWHQGKAAARHRRKSVVVAADDRAGSARRLAGNVGYQGKRVFFASIDPDWQDPLLLGWIDSARRMPGLALPPQLLPLHRQLDPWPPPLPRKTT